MECKPEVGGELEDQNLVEWMTSGYIVSEIGGRQPRIETYGGKS